MDIYPWIYIPYISSDPDIFWIHYGYFMDTWRYIRFTMSAIYLLNLKLQWFIKSIISRAICNYYAIVIKSKRKLLVALILYCTTCTEHVCIRVLNTDGCANTRGCAQLGVCGPNPPRRNANIPLVNSASQLDQKHSSCPLIPKSSSPSLFDWFSCPKALEWEISSVFDSPQQIFGPYRRVLAPLVVREKFAENWKNAGSSHWRSVSGFPLF